MEIIKEFEKLQKTALGFVKYAVRGSKEEYAIDVYTQSGLLIKTKHSYQPEENIKTFIEKYSTIFKKELK